LPNRRKMNPLAHGRISKSSEPLKGASSGRRGWRRFDGEEKIVQANSPEPSLSKSADAGCREGPRGYAASGVRRAKRTASALPSGRETEGSGGFRKPPTR